jgi:hypothetical protein
MPYCSFRLSQDGVEDKAQNRPWFNQSLNVRGMWIEELGRRIRITPVKLKYEGVICVQHDTDLYWLQQRLVWEESNETIIKPVLETVDEKGKPQQIANIAVTTLTPHMNSRFSENDWVTNNKIQAIDIDVQIDTYLILDQRKGYWITKSALLEFAAHTLPWLKIRRKKNGEIEQIITSEIFT